MDVNGHRVGVGASKEDKRVNRELFEAVFGREPGRSKRTSVAATTGSVGLFLHKSLGNSFHEYPLLGIYSDGDACRDRSDRRRQGTDVVAIANLAGVGLVHHARDGGANVRQVADMLKPVANPLWIKVAPNMTQHLDGFADVFGQFCPDSFHLPSWVELDLLLRPYTGPEDQQAPFASLIRLTSLIFGSSVAKRLEGLPPWKAPQSRRAAVPREQSELVILAAQLSVDLAAFHLLLSTSCRNPMVWALWLVPELMEREESEAEPPQMKLKGCLIEETRDQDLNLWRSERWHGTLTEMSISRSQLLAKARKTKEEAVVKKYWTSMDAIRSAYAYAQHLLREKTDLEPKLHADIMHPLELEASFRSSNSSVKCTLRLSWEGLTPSVSEKVRRSDPDEESSEDSHKLKIDVLRKARLTWARCLVARLEPLLSGPGLGLGSYKELKALLEDSPLEVGLSKARRRKSSQSPKRKLKAEKQRKVERKTPPPMDPKPSKEPPETGSLETVEETTVPVSPEPIPSTSEQAAIPDPQASPAAAASKNERQTEPELEGDLDILSEAEEEEVEQKGLDSPEVLREVLAKSPEPRQQEAVVSSDEEGEVHEEAAVEDEEFREPSPEPQGIELEPGDEALPIGFEEEPEGTAPPKPSAKPQRAASPARQKRKSPPRQAKSRGGLVSRVKVEPGLELRMAEQEAEGVVTLVSPTSEGRASRTSSSPNRSASRHRSTHSRGRRSRSRSRSHDRRRKRSRSRSRERRRRKRSRSRSRRSRSRSRSRERRTVRAPTGRLASENVTSAAEKRRRLREEVARQRAEEQQASLVIKEELIEDCTEDPVLETQTSAAQPSASQATVVKGTLQTLPQASPSQSEPQPVPAPVPLPSAALTSQKAAGPKTTDPTSSKKTVKTSSPVKVSSWSAAEEPGSQPAVLQKERKPSPKPPPMPQASAAPAWLTADGAKAAPAPWAQLAQDFAARLAQATAKQPKGDAQTGTSSESQSQPSSNEKPAGSPDVEVLSEVGSGIEILSTKPSATTRRPSAESDGGSALKEALSRLAASTVSEGARSREAESAKAEAQALAQVKAQEIVRKGLKEELARRVLDGEKGLKIDWDRMTITQAPISSVRVSGPSETHGWAGDFSASVPRPVPPPVPAPSFVATPSLSAPVLPAQPVHRDKHRPPPHQPVSVGPAAGAGWEELTLVGVSPLGHAAGATPNQTEMMNLKRVLALAKLNKLALALGPIMLKAIWRLDEARVRCQVSAMFGAELRKAAALFAHIGVSIEAEQPP